MGLGVLLLAATTAATVSFECPKGEYRVFAGIGLIMNIAIIDGSALPANTDHHHHIHHHHIHHPTTIKAHSCGPSFCKQASV